MSRTPATSPRTLRIQALLRLYEGSIKALLKLYEGSMKALVRLYAGCHERLPRTSNAARAAGVSVLVHLYFFTIKASKEVPARASRSIFGPPN